MTWKFTNGHRGDPLPGERWTLRHINYREIIMKYVVQCTTPYVERFMVGIEAASPDEALFKKFCRVQIVRPGRHHAGKFR